MVTNSRIILLVASLLLGLAASCSSASTSGSASGDGGPSSSGSTGDSDAQGGSSASGSGASGTGSDGGTMGEEAGATVLSAALSYYTGCAVLAGGDVQCWGDNMNGQLGNGSTPGPTTASAAPVQVTGLTSGA